MSFFTVVLGLTKMADISFCYKKSDSEIDIRVVFLCVALGKKNFCVILKQISWVCFDLEFNSALKSSLADASMQHRTVKFHNLSQVSKHFGTFCQLLKRAIARLCNPFIKLGSNIMTIIAPLNYL